MSVLYTWRRPAQEEALWILAEHNEPHNLDICATRRIYVYMYYIHVYMYRIAGIFRQEKIRQSQGQCIAEKIRQIYFCAAWTGRN